VKNLPETTLRLACVLLVLAAVVACGSGGADTAATPADQGSGVGSGGGGGSSGGASGDLCAGAGVGTTAAVSYTLLAKPAKGTAVLDPDFGTTIRRITDVKADWGSAVAVPAYPTIQAWNSDESLMILYVTSGTTQGWALFDGRTYSFKKWLDINPADVEQFYWSTTNPAQLYYVDNHESGGSYTHALTRIDVNTGVKTVLHDFANDMKTGGILANACPISGRVSGGNDPFYMSYDNDVMGLGCYLNKNGPNGAAAYASFSYRISSNSIGTPFTVEADVAQALPSGRGTYFYKDNSSTVSVLDASTNAVQRTLTLNGSEHGDMLLSSTGDDLVVSAQFDGTTTGTLVVGNLTRGGVKAVIAAYPPTGTLISGKSWRNPGWVALASTGCPAGSNGNCQGATPSAASTPQTYLDQEILLANVDTGVTCRVAHHRTTGNYANSSNSNYWAQPNLVISPSGTRILFASDWGAANPKSPTINGAAVVDTYVVELPGYR